jgi:hypothetical protein
MNLDPRTLVALMFAAFALVAVGIFLYIRRREAERSEKVERAARLLGFDFQKERSGLLEAEWAKSHLFQQGRRRHAFNVMKGSVGAREGTLFDYRYTTGSGNHSRTHRQTVAAIHLPERRLPGFELRPENVFHKIASAFKYQDIDFSTHPGFSGRYLLRGEDEQAVRRLFETRLLSFFERKTGWSVEGGGDWILLYRQEKRPKPEELRTFLQECEEIARVFESR